MSLLMVDIDHFKRINDTFGHDTGDAAPGKITLTASIGVTECSRADRAKHSGRNRVCAEIDGARERKAVSSHIFYMDIVDKLG